MAVRSRVGFDVDGLDAVVTEFTWRAAKVSP